MILIKNVNVLSMNTSSIDRNKSILIRAGLIESIVDSSFAPTGDCEVIDGNNGYVMPGLINMHTHLGDNRDDLLLYLANGVTTIRNMWGYEGFRLRNWLLGTRVFNHLQLKKLVEEGRVTGPSIYTAGPLLDGDPPFFPRFMYLNVVTAKSQIAQVIKEQAEKGYDFIKIYSALSRQSFDDIVEIAGQYDIPVAGHAPDLAGIEHVLGSRVQSIEHLYGFINPYRPELNVKREDVVKLAHIAAENNVWNCPTLIANERLANTRRQEEFESESQMEYISSRNKKAMRFLMKESSKLFDSKGVKGNHEYMEDFYFIVRQLKSEGAGILLGTDKAVPYVVAGFSEHHEMKLLSQAGLSNFDVIQAATVNAARCLRREEEIGTVEPGKKADLIITRDNPLNNQDAIKDHSGVIKSGVYYSRGKCDELLKEVKIRLS
jgi:imidazolonepropionase-like amidohydrolase